MKKAFTLIELMIVMAVAAILGGIAMFGVSRARKDEGVRADYLLFYEQMRSSKLRANLGKLYGGTTVQTFAFTMGLPYYWVNNVRVDFPQARTMVYSISCGGNTYTSGSASIFFYPDNYTVATMPTRYGGCSSCGVNFTGDLTINLSSYSSPSMLYPIVISGSGYKINSINTGVPVKLP